MFLSLLNAIPENMQESNKEEKCWVGKFFLDSILDSCGVRNMYTQDTTMLI